MSRFLLLVLCVLVFSAADFFAARWGHTRDRASLLVVLLVGPCAYLVFGRLAAVSSLAAMGAYVNCGIVLGTAAAGVLLLGERPSRTTWIGILVVVLGLALVSLGKMSRAET
jgi:drug/metabolite transporter (DMT)-like permease